VEHFFSVPGGAGRRPLRPLAWRGCHRGTPSTCEDGRGLPRPETSLFAGRLCRARSPAQPLALAAAAAGAAADVPLEPGLQANRKTGACPLDADLIARPGPAPLDAAGGAAAAGRLVVGALQGSAVRR